MSLKDQVRARIDQQRGKIQHWRDLVHVRDERQDEVADAIDEAREDVNHMRELVPELEHRHEGFTEAELHERWMELRHSIAENLELIDRLVERLATVRETTQKAQAHTEPHPATSELIVTFDNYQVASWMVRDALEPARASGIWTGHVLSGFRSPEYSTSLCIDRCGAPSCSGTCAGISSNHSCPPSHTGTTFEGAVDVVEDPEGLQRWCAANGFPIIHTLPDDPGHFSRTGA